MRGWRARNGGQQPTRGLSLVARFALISLVMVVAMGLGLAHLLQRTVHDRVIGDAERTATVAARVGILPALQPADFGRNFAPLTPERRAELDDRLSGAVSDDAVVRIKVWNLQHWIVYSDNERLIGRWFPSRPLIRDSFEGATTSEVTDLEAPEELEEREFGRLLAVYVPLRLDDQGGFTNDPDGEVVGSFEIYLPYEPIASTIRSATLRLQGALALGLVSLYLAVYRMVARASRKLRRQADENLHQALHDSLTGLPNRVLFSDRVEQALALARREGTDVAVLILDLDRFKEINDTLGHHHGDELLSEVARRLVDRLRGSDSVARLGGDEFAVLLPRVPSPDDARLVALELLRMLEEPIVIGGLELDVHASVGVAISPHHGEDVGTLMQHADVALYVAKSTHSRVEVYDPSSDTNSQERLELAAELRQAIEDRQLVVHYQPKVDARSRRVMGVEALVRWQHPTRGLLGPGLFLPAIEHTELMRPLTEFVLEEAARQAAVWRRRGWDVPVAVNLSARTVADETLPARVSRLLRDHGLPPRALELELTESAVLANPERAARVLGDVHGAGVSIAIDDFGSGYASVAYLTQFPLDCVKIDQQFVMPMLDDPKARSIVQFTIDLGRTLELHVVAEGVETDALADALTELGCDLLQGYGICRPAAPEQLDEFLGRNALQLAELAP